MTIEQLALISTDPTVMHGQAVIAGTRVPVSVVLDCLAAGMTVEQIVAEYPTVTPRGCRRRPPTARYWPARSSCRSLWANEDQAG